MDAVTFAKWRGRERERVTAGDFVLCDLCNGVTDCDRVELAETHTAQCSSKRYITRTSPLHLQGTKYFQSMHWWRATFLESFGQ